jgi:hypothetical protein
MKTIFHIFKKDSRQQRGGLVFWFILLAMRLWNDLQPLSAERTGGPILGGIVIYLIAAAAFVFIPAVMSDPLGNRQAFYRTRPIRFRDIIGAKFLFLVAWIIGPACVAETVYLLNQSLPSLFIAASIGERFIFLLVFGTAIGATATGFLSTSSAIKHILACLPIAFAGIFLWPWLGGQFNVPGLGQSISSAFGWLFAGIFVASACSFLAWRATSRRTDWFALWLPYAMVAFLVPMFSANWQSNLGTTRPLAKDTLPPSSIPQSGLHVTAFDHANDPNKAQVQLTAKPTTDVATGSVIEWAITDMTMKDSLSKRLSEGFRRPTGQVFNRRSHSQYRSQDIEAISSLLPPTVQVAHGTSGQWTMNQIASASVATARSPEIIESLTSIQGRLRGRQFEWKLLGEIALQKGSQLSSQQSNWRYLDIKQNRNSAFDIKLAWGRPNLNLTRDQHWQAHSDNAMTRHEYVIYQEEDQILFTPESDYTYQNLGGLTGYRQSVVTLQFRQSGGQNLRLPLIDPSKAKILVFEKIFRKEETLAFEKRDIRLIHQFQANGSNMRPPEKLPRSEFHSRLQELGPPPIGADRTQAGHYLYKVIKLVQARDEWIQPNDALANKLAPLAHDHPEMFLDGLRNAQHRAAQLLEAVLQQGISEDQKGLVIERLSRLVTLSDMVLARGWHEEARDAFVTLAKERENLPISVIRGLILLDESETYPDLLNDFQKHPTLAYYDALRTIPALQDDLDLRVRLIWERRPRVLSHRLNTQAVYSIALRHGMREPFDEIYQVLSWIDQDNFSYGYGISRAIQENVDLDEIPPYQRNNTRKVLAWLLKQKPEWFHYDPSRRLFYIKKA